VRVQVDANVNCKGLEIKSGWKTHGKGNVSSGETETITAFAGQWQAGEQLEYPFELMVAEWPPTYHGTFLNIDHSIDARAKIAWAFDPKSSKRYQVKPVAAPESLEVKPKATQLSGPVGCFVVGLIVVMIVFPVLFLVTNPIVGVVVAALASIGGIVYFVRCVMPVLALGKVEFDFPTHRVSPGTVWAGTIRMRPRKSVAINSILLDLAGKEICVSGSGSNRTTHTHEIMSHTMALADGMKLDPGGLKELPVEVAMPETDAFTCDLGDNEIKWSVRFLIDIPRWPDYRQTIEVELVPSDVDAGEATVSNLPRADAVSTAAPDGAGADVGSGGDITFSETVAHFYAIRGDDEQAELLAEAVIGLSFEIEAFVERRLLYSGDEDPHVYEDGYAVWAHYSDPPLPLALYVPHHLADEFEQAGRDLWRGRGTVVGWDRDHGRLQIKL
ncbi:MAG: hypothetical protein AAF989_14975, partial [Planctomycetota bacterium]